MPQQQTQTSPPKTPILRSRSRREVTTKQRRDNLNQKLRLNRIRGAYEEVLQSTLMIKEVLLQNLFLEFNKLSKDITDTIPHDQIWPYGYHFASGVLLHNTILNDNQRTSLTDNKSFGVYKDLEKFLLDEHYLKIDTWYELLQEGIIAYFESKKQQMNEFLVAFCAFLYVFLPKNHQHYRMTPLYELSSFYRYDGYY